MDEELKPQQPAPAVDAEGVATEGAARAQRVHAGNRMPTLYLGHGAPPLVDDPLWVAQLKAWAGALPRPKSVLIVSAHWENAPLTMGATRTGTPLVYDFGGFPERYYRQQYRSPGAPGFPADLGRLRPVQPVAKKPDRGPAPGASEPPSAPPTGDGCCPIRPSPRSRIGGSTTAPTSC